jgi:hypothetical protein
VTILEDLAISVSIPQQALVNMSIHIDGMILGEVSGPILGLDAILIVDGIQMRIDSTNSAGEFNFILSFDNPGIYILGVKVSLDLENHYNSSISSQFSIVIHSLPSDIELISPRNNSVYGAILELSFQGDALNYWYFIDPLDQSNISWTETVYRELPEGSYSCTVYGENSFGVVSSVSSFFRIDSTAPSLVMINPKNGTYNTKSIILSYLTNANNTITFLDDVIISGESGTVLNDLSEGIHNLTIKARDEAGNFVIKRVFFETDTIIPYLAVRSPHNYSYIESVPLLIDSDGELILYSLPGVFDSNYTYSSPIQFNLPVGGYKICIYVYDSAGNINTTQINFSVVERADILKNSNLIRLDNAGNYILRTEILPDSNFSQIGYYLNGVFFGNLDWNILYQEYQSSFKLPSPGTWEIYLYGMTTDRRYDIIIFEETWIPPLPLISSFSASWESSFYEIRVMINSHLLDLNLVQVTIADKNYSLTHLYGDLWYIQLNCDPQNYTIILDIWYPWDVEPSIRKDYQVFWYAPQIIVENSNFERNGFDLEIRIEEVNASLSGAIPSMYIGGENQNYTIIGTLVYESSVKNYQIWHFTSPWLVPDLWYVNFSINDLYGHSNHYFTLYNSIDTPPFIGDSRLIVLENSTAGVLYQLTVETHDDYSIDKAILYINGLEYPYTVINDSHIIFSFFLTPGEYFLQISVSDDINQETIRNLINLNVQGLSSHNNTSESNDKTSKSYQTSPHDTQQEIQQFIGLGDLIEIIIGTSVFAIIATLGKSLLAKREEWFK